jgi:hypothetical protein
VDAVNAKIPTLRSLFTNSSFLDVYHRMLETTHHDMSEKSLHRFKVPVMLGYTEMLVNPEMEAVGILDILVRGRCLIDRGLGDGI